MTQTCALLMSQTREKRSSTNAKGCNAVGWTIMGLRQRTGPRKMFWYLVDFEHTNNKWKYKKCNQAPSHITMLDSSHKQVTIQQLEPSEA